MFKIFLAAVLSTGFLAGMTDAQVLSDNGQPLKYGARSVPRGLDLCNDYLSPRNYAGEPYRIVEKDRIVTRHEGMDFCAPAGTPVIAPVSGAIIWSVQDHPLRGGQVLIKTDFRVRLKAGSNESRPVYIGLVHMTPKRGLARGQRVRAGDPIGVVQAAGLPEIGSRSHIHYTARICESHTCHIDPNMFWNDGPGRVSCLGGALPKGKIVAPYRC
ncbi:hypothetical protein ATO6_16685 [Oceanicola sp. 22II-s10i]|uniref:M23 family metallopeptidase n=1 Tax=Oceanicola sp. 22II-s10i TaxID=1317116 RepID=UPI000B523494|nr:peptidoglycan DD-metalloendopeptidase family protein [Oceanicola sp. 22II-s10i]OWU84032.1 hypothetical protein ATO6_16685 [Oceanicola sp. 22II-s10i]